MLKIVVYNLGFLLVMSVPALVGMLFSRFTDSMWLDFAANGAGIMLCSIYLSAAAYTMSPVSDYQSVKFTDFFRNFKRAWLPGIIMGLFVSFLFAVATIILPFYISMPQVIGIVLGAIIIWFTVFALLSFQYYFAVYKRLGGKIGKSIKKCMIISLDNTGFSFFLFIHNLIVVVLMFMMLRFPFLIILLFLPGPVGILLYIDEALRLRIFKYDWLEANPGANRKKIPWEELIIEEREKVGTRSFRNFIFPWKD